MADQSASLYQPLPRGIRLHTSSRPSPWGDFAELTHPLVRCAPGDAKATRAFRLPAKHVIHTVPPKWNDPNAEATLEGCYVKTLEVARKLHVQARAT